MLYVLFWTVRYLSDGLVGEPAFRTLSPFPSFHEHCCELDDMHVLRRFCYFALKHFEYSRSLLVTSLCNHRIRSIGLLCTFSLVYSNPKYSRYKMQLITPRPSSEPELSVSAHGR